MPANRRPTGTIIMLQRNNQRDCFDIHNNRFCVQALSVGAHTRYSGPAPATRCLLVPFG
jgi:hypothetical protein